MSFPVSGPRIAGQDSDFLDILFSSSEVPGRLPSSPLPGKQMYGNSESIKSWINAIDRASLIITLSIVVTDCPTGQQTHL